MSLLPKVSLRQLGTGALALGLAIAGRPAAGAEPASPPGGRADWGGCAALVAEGAVLEKLSAQFTFTEGPAADSAGNVYFTDQPDNKIWKWDINDRLSLFHSSPGRANGLFFDNRDRLISCSDLNNELWEIDTGTGQHTVLAGGFEGKKFNGPNDAWARPDNALYFTDPLYVRAYWGKNDPAERIPTRDVYFLSADRKVLKRAASGLKQPNGIIGTADGKFLFVADIDDNKTYRYAIQPDGSLSDRVLFAPLGSDGMTLDNAGNLYLTGNGVTVFDKTGRRLGNIPVPGGWTANVCFGGTAHDHLFITTTRHLHRLKMRVKAAEKPPVPAPGQPNLQNKDS